MLSWCPCTSFDLCSPVEELWRRSSMAAMLTKTTLLFCLVRSFGIVLWELFTESEPWKTEGLSSAEIEYQVVAGKRPSIPARLRAEPANAAYIALIEECWSQDPQDRPTFAQVVARLKEMCLFASP